MKKIIYSAVIIGIMIFMFLNPIAAMSASKKGVLLWSETIIPTLLPFMILSNLIIQLNIVSQVTFFIAPLFQKLLGISSEGCYAVIIGFLCGYPMGAKVTSDMVANQSISKVEGQYLLNFCNNVSPMFIITYLVNESMEKNWILVPTLLILYTSPILCAILLNYSYRKNCHLQQIHKTIKTSKVQINFELVDTSINNGFINITKLGGYIILFSIISEIVMNIPLPNLFIKYIIAGLTEITTGIGIISKSSLSFAYQYVLLLAITSFGGLSSIAQTESMIKASGLSLIKYIRAKLLNMVITILLAFIFLF